ncbi:hypothetical protein PIB30_023698 [Stylosanthes scabra]|uniref:BZIP domain-containing protein n=1 Tax=Stylosanthes scabra TaxID=79078 RepID=A0ABU6U8L5_9FABA|nr:hypothetical protein [Stylosanthes scabra]
MSNTKRHIGRDDEKVVEQPWPKRPTLIKPLPLRNSANKAPLCFGSSFKPWRKPSHDENINNGSDKNYMANTINNNEVQVIGSISNNTNQEMDPKRLRRIMSNRISAQKAREKSNAYVADLENKSKAYEEQIALILPQIESQQTRLSSLRMEQHKLKLLMATCEKERLIQEEVERLRALQLKLAAEAEQAWLVFPSTSGFGPFITNNSIQG